jgi:hypothetical protein
MGLTFSTPPPGAELTLTEVATIIDTAKKHQFQVMMDVGGLSALFRAATASVEKDDDDARRRIGRAVEECQRVFRADYTIYTQEVLTSLALTCHGASWEARAHLLFRVFSSVGTDEMTHEDVMLAAQVVAAVLSKLWDAHRWCSKSMSQLAEKVADDAFLKGDKEIDEPMDRATFVRWATRRFPETTVASSLDQLRLLYQQT